MQTIRIDRGRTGFEPGETLSGQLEWHLETAPRALELRLFWYTAGRGDTNAEILERVRIERPKSAGSSAFELELPRGPYSFSGELISICWALELVAEPAEETTRVDFVLAPGGLEVHGDPTTSPAFGVSR